MRPIVTALAGLLLASGGLATFSECPADSVDVFTTKACCATSPLRKRRHLYSRTDFCSDGNTPCCDTKAPGPPTVSSGGTTDLQCGSKYDPASDSDDVPGGVTYTLEPCLNDASQTCLHVKLIAAAGQTVSDIHLAILDGSGDPNALPNGLGNWPQNEFCSFSGNEGNCWVPVSTVLSVLNPTSTSLCGQDIIVAAGISINGATCFNRGSLIGDPSKQGGRWFMYTTVSFTCPDVCTHSCCCPPPPPPPPQEHWCELGTAFGYKADSAINFNGSPIGPALTANTCKRWGWYYSVPSSIFTAPDSLTGTLIVGAGGNDVSKGTPVGTFSATLSGTALTVSYSLSGGYDLGEVHIYASCTKPASCAPGSYTYPTSATPSPDLSGTADTSLQTTITVGSCSSYYLIFHAKVNKSFPASIPCPVTVA
ncbi:hypothetical protein QBC43DRAFT_199553 [Cladorrhinum sp. PSN259]|nr:hypothetical protein QBC43DRAFT_199553 [Cladorrhinum sp. PSN259]